MENPSKITINYDQSPKYIIQRFCKKI